MLWYKAWLETRWRFLIGLGLLAMLACGGVLEYPRVAKLIPLVPAIDDSGVVGRALQKAIDAERTYRGFIWWQWVQDNLAHTWTVFAALLGTGGLLSRASGGSVLFTLSLPVPRSRVLGARAATALVELLALALLPSLVPPLLSPLIGQHYSLVDALVHGTCVFVGGTVFFSLAFLLSTVFTDVWRPPLLACLVAVALAFAEPVLLGASRFGIFNAMNAEVYFRTGAIPWPGLLFSMAASAALLYAAFVNTARTDF